MVLDCELILPCRNEAGALPALLARVPEGMSVVVVDNGSTDGTADVARARGARVVVEHRPGYGAAVQAGVNSARARYVAVMDGDGSLDPAQLLPLLADVARGRATMAVGRRRPMTRAAMAWHARAFNLMAAWWIGRRTGLRLHDIPSVRVTRRVDLLALGVRDLRFGYPVEVLVRAHRAGWSVVEHDMTYGPRAEGTTSKVSGSLRGSAKAARDLVKALP
ncbi:glycosyltransferase family 2 protein [Pedococcus sp. KACC 23699]|uniref:Glycosyltransferase family 2 protein n=1 Tax=Pedococcus sp. KACC 23699 TaxID=3149228 RepID=A0AAU7JQA0_9MICO